MIKDKSASLGLVSSLTTSLCCIAPLVAAIGGVSGVAATFSWIGPFRPYLAVSSVLLLGAAWIQKLHPTKSDECGCKLSCKRRITRSMYFLASVSILAVLIMIFPLYTHKFYRQSKPVDVAAATSVTPPEKVEYTLKGMSCASCEPEVEMAITKLHGIRSVKASCIQKNTVVKYDPTQTNIELIQQAINRTGYTVQNIK